MPSQLDREFDAALARLTGPEGPFQMGLVECRGQILPYVTSAPPTLPEFFAYFCDRYGDRDFLVDGDQRLSFKETYAAARKVAGGLITGHGVRKGDRVGLAARNANGWIIAYMGILMAGGIATLLNGFWSGEELVDAIEDVGCDLVIADVSRAARIKATGRELGAKIVQIELDGPISDVMAPIMAHGGSKDTPIPELAADDNATILFTSGSTGRSKGAVSDHRGVIQGALSFVGNTICMLDIFEHRGEPPPHLPATLLNVPLFHITAEISVLLHSFAIGRKLVIMPKWDAEEAMRLIEREKCTYFVGVPLMSYEIVNHPRRGQYDLSSLTDMASGGAPRPVEHVRRIAQDMPGTHPVIGYGLTETNAAGCGNFRENYIDHPDSTGKVSQPLVELAIIDDAGNHLSVGQHGEIAFRTVCNFKYYWNRAEDTQAAFTADGFFRTGDIGYVDEEGYLTIVDRKKDIIIRGGENISSPEVEAALYEHPAVKECTVFGLPDPRYGEIPGAVVYLHEGEELTAQALCDFLKTQLALFKIPAHIWFSETQLQRLGTEKIDKRAIREVYRKMLP